MRQSSKSTSPPSLPKALALLEIERDQLQGHLNLVGVDRYRYDYSQEDQDHAFDLFSQLGLHFPDGHRDVRSKMSIRKSDSKSVGPGKKYTRWTRLYQCLCGTNNSEGRRVSKKRRIPWEDVKCSMYAQVVMTQDDGDLLVFNEISGILDHNAACIEQIQMSRDPIIPLHPELRAHALSLLRTHTPISRVRSLCRDWATERWGITPGDTTHRYILREYESTSLYRSLRQEAGIPTQSKAVENLDQWFRKENPQPPQELLTESLMYYQPIGPGLSDRLALILSTPRQQELAWQYGHKKQLLMDGTFGVCSTAILVFFLMVIDDRNIGIPVATIIFTPKKDAKAAHASYDNKILEQLLGAWKQSMGVNSNGETFQVAIANTDNDTRERAALEKIWPGLHLILCMFHTWQAWRNGLNRYLACVPRGEARQEVRSRLGRFLMHLLKDITEYPVAQDAYNQELIYFQKLGESDSAIRKKQSQGALAFLGYLKSYLAVPAFWASWSMAGVLSAAKILGIPPEIFPRTTNHLESFNGRCKSKYFDPYQHSGRLPRLDNWVLLLISRVFPDFFREYDERRRMADHYTRMRTMVPAATHSDSDTSNQSTSSNMIPRDSTAITMALDADVEHTMLQELSDDEMYEISTSDPDVDMDSSVDAPHNPLEPELFQIASNHGSDSDFDQALDESEILPNLPADMSIEIPYSPNQGLLPSSPNQNFFDLQDPPGPIHGCNAEVIAYQSVLEVEDRLAACLRNLIAVSRNADPEAVLLAVVDRLRPQLITRTASPGPETPEQDIDYNLYPQRKERRKQSYNIR
ncbi:hypothetical protein BD779DRAFT_1808345 [Infundibulicybe gibba]|nr:hypothetical protein BD779DRAFT_1808345 [Infundibulicybe gibba]